MRNGLTAMCLCASLAACDDGGTRIRLYDTQPIAPELRAEDVENLTHLGPTMLETGTNFGVYSERATRVDLLVFEDPEAELPTKRFPMSRFGNVWNLYVEGIGEGTTYGFIAWGPNWPEHPKWYPGSIHGFIADVDGEGNRFNPNKLLFDPYGKALTRDHDWSRASNASGPARTESTWAAAAKSIVWKSAYEWSATEADWQSMRQAGDAGGHRWNDLIIYETHPKGFTASPASAVTHPGTYRGLGEKAAYFADLGVTAVELLPVHEKPLDGGYWGYNNLSWFVPEVSYAATHDPLEVADEFKWMVDQLHQQGIEVILDVVYNHTGEGGLWREKLLDDDVVLDPRTQGQLVDFDPKEVASLYALRGLDNHAYYALTADNQFFWNDTNVGNQTRANHRPLQKLIVDSLRFYVEEMHVDGFRFDLAPILGVKDGQYDTWDDPASTVLQDIIDDPVLATHQTRIIAEPWAGGAAGYRLGGFPAATDAAGVGWYEWNGKFRDWWRTFLNDDGWRLSSTEGDADGGFVMTASERLWRWNGRRPYHSINYVTIHDGFTLYDLFSYDGPENNCGPLNPLCCSEPLSPWCDVESGERQNRSRDWGGDQEPLKRQLMRNAFLAMMFSHGTPMLLGGDEWMRTQLGNNNAYSTRADNSYNWFDWGTWQADDARHRMHDFVRSAIALRKRFAYAFAPADWGAGAPFRWLSPQGTEPPDWSSRRLMIHYHDRTRGPEVVILINLERDFTTFDLPGASSWRRLVDTQAYFDGPAWFGAHPEQDQRRSANATLDTPEPIPGSTYQAAASSIVVLEAVE